MAIFPDGCLRTPSRRSGLVQTLVVSPHRFCDNTISTETPVRPYWALFAICVGLYTYLQKSVQDCLESIPGGADEEGAAAIVDTHFREPTSPTDKPKKVGV